MDTQAGEKEEQREVRKEKDQKNLAAFQVKDGESQSVPGESDEQEPKNVTGDGMLNGPGKKFNGEQKTECGEEEYRKALPPLKRQPGRSGGEFEPAGDEEMEQKPGNGGAYKQSEGSAGR